MSESGTVPALSRAAIDRAGLRRDDAVWLANAWKTGRLLVVDGDARAVIDEGPSLHFLDSGTWEGDGLRLLLGVDDDGRACWGTVDTLAGSLGSQPAELRAVGAALSDADAGLFVALIALSNWHRSHTHCPRCGTVTVVAQAGWSRVCPNDQSQHFPRTDPAIIVLLHDGGDRALLGRQSNWPQGRYSTIAGFVEAGESAEQALHREVQEETGVTVDNVVYYGSQSWPFPQSLMLGYEARVSGGTIETVDQELEDVRWFTREELRTGPHAMPSNTSIAYWLIHRWIDRGRQSAGDGGQ